MHSDRAERPRDDRDHPYSRPRDERFERRHDERDRDRGYDRPEQHQVREDRRWRDRSPAPRSDRDRERRPSPRHDGRARPRSRSRSPTRKRRSSPSSPPGESRNYGREFPSRPRESSHYDQSQNYRYRPSDSPHHRAADSSNSTTPGVSATTALNRGPQNLDPINAVAGKAPTEPTLSDPSLTAVPSGPASWRRAQQYKQERPYHQDYRPNPAYGRGATPLNPGQRTSIRPSFPSNPHSPAPLPNNSPTVTSPIAHRIPTGPRALARPTDPPTKKEYSSPVPELDEKLTKLKAEHEKLEAKDAEIQKRKRLALAQWTFLDRESKREAAKVKMAEKLLETTVNGTLFAG